MGDFLKAAQERETTQAGEVLKVVKTVKRNDKTLAVCETAADGQYVLARERERGKVGADKKRSRDNGTERFFKRTSALADIGDAIDGGLL